MNQIPDSAFLEGINAAIKSDLAPLTQDIDQKGTYPEDFMHKLGALGGFRASIPTEQGGLGLGLAQQIAVATAVGAECGSTAFLVWCQSVCAWYLLHTPNDAVRERYLGPVARGELLSGSGMSNAVKHLAGIEKMHLKARRDGDHYIIDGILPWVSNFGEGHLVIVTAQVEDEGYVMFAIRDTADGLSLHPCPTFSGMEGTQTFNLRFREAVIDSADVIAHPDQFEAFIERIKAGFILMQAGMGFGVIKGCLNTMRKANITHAHVNVFLDDQEEGVAKELKALESRATKLAAQAQTGYAPVLEVLKLRARASELALSAANSAALHAGARGYLMRHPAQRRLREAIFVSIVTPALKHLRKEIHDLETVTQQAQVAG